MRLSLDQIIAYQTHGVLIAEHVLTDEDLQPVIDEIERVIDERAEALHGEGKLQNLHKDEPFERRYSLLYRQCPEIGRSLDIMDYGGEAMFAFLRNDNLLDVVECLLGSEISCNPIQHLRHKLPVEPGMRHEGYDGNVPWHQDVAVTHPDSDASEIITFWVPLVDATAETGCMEIVPDVFKKGYLTHRKEGGTSIVPELLEANEPMRGECRKGGVVIMNKYTPHRSTDNVSGIVRWSIDLRYHKSGAHSGRETHPSFVVRSKADPDSVLTDHREWRRMWKEALAKPIHSLHRV